MTTTVLSPCGGCGDLIDVELPEDGSDETNLLMDALCEGCLEYIFDHTTP